MAELVLRLRDREMGRAPVLTTRFTIGRDTSADLVIDNAGVSRTHAVVTFDNQMYYVADADSQNGIMLNGRPVKESSLNYGDVIGIGKFEIELVESLHQPVIENQGMDLPKRNVMRTMQMDAGAAARIRDEALARIAAQKGLPPPATASSSRTTQPNPRQQPVQESSDVAAVMKIVAMVLAAIVAIAGGILFLLRD